MCDCCDNRTWCDDERCTKKSINYTYNEPISNSIYPIAKDILCHLRDSVYDMHWQETKFSNYEEYYEEMTYDDMDPYVPEHCESPCQNNVDDDVVSDIETEINNDLDEPYKNKFMYL